MATRLRQSINEFEAAFHEETEADRQHREAVVRRAHARTHSRRLERQHKHGTLRFTLLVLLLVATAVAVTVAMFETLYIVMG
jgi:ABC-type Zn2+ transport system substrate-binding protein/surface adhesin